MTDNKMSYEIHLQNGEVWLCNGFGYAGDDPDAFIPEWCDTVDFVMTHALLAKYRDWDVQPEPVVYLLQGVSAVIPLSEPKLCRWDAKIESMVDEIES